ncbi:MAG TPA: hypothetical protein VHY37_12260 [Tepidisphaeraceae bacterium]|nr:hypothetical protein [Tepidisphaeraceae bacterium]
MARYFLIAAVLVAAPVLLAQCSSPPATAPSADAYPLYEKAANLIQENDQHQVCSPSSSGDTFPPYSPFGDAWRKMEKQDYDVDARVRDLVHQAAGIDRAEWPRLSFDPNNPPPDHNYLSDCREIANDLKDAAIYQSLYLKDQPAAFQTLNDIQHVADLLQNQLRFGLVRELGADGLVALNVDTSDVIVSGVGITNDPAKHADLPIATARQWINRLLDHPTAKAQLKTALASESQLTKKESAFQTQTELPGSPALVPTMPEILKLLRRGDAERDLAAMSLAAHVYRFEHHRWPANEQELATELPKMLIDPFGDEKQTLGYVLVRRGLPDGGDRPLVYSRDNSKDGLFYRTDVPEYEFYRGDGSSQIQTELGLQKEGGQFRDVARWAPAAPHAGLGPATRPIGP